MTWKLYTNEACTQAFGGTLSFTHYTNDIGTPQDKVLYYANIDEDPIDNGALKMVDPAGGNILITASDLTPGVGHETTEIKIAATHAELDMAIAGASLSLGTQLISGLSSKRAIHVRVTNTQTTPGVSTDLGFDKAETHILSAV